MKVVQKPESKSNSNDFTTVLSITNMPEGPSKKKLNFNQQVKLKIK
jgi:hypothetical protein